MVARAMFIFAGICLAWRLDAATTASLPLKPVKPWILDYADTQCVASRDYGDGADAQTFAIRPAPNGESFELIIARQVLGPKYAATMDGSVSFGGQPIKSSMLHYSAKNRSINIYQYRISAANMAQARSSSAVAFKSKGSLDLTLSLGSMSALLDGLNQCVADLQRYWNIENRYRPVGTPVRGDIRRLFSSDDYPDEAMSKGQEGAGRFLLLIDEAGKIAACHVYEPSGVAVLDTMGCQVIRERARFKPALDANGKPVRSTYVTPKVNWTLGF